MPIRPEYQDVDMDNFFDQLSSLKDANLGNLRNSVIDAPNQPVMPKVENPNKMQDKREEIMANKQIASERSSSWTLKGGMKQSTKRALELGIIGYITYKFFL